jgi:hypothetical protein
MWLFLLLEVLILTGFGVAIVMSTKHKNNTVPFHRSGCFKLNGSMRNQVNRTMATRTKSNPITVIKSNRSDIDIEILAMKIAEAVATRVAQEFIDKLGTVGYIGSRQSPKDIEGAVCMDESIIPININITGIDTDIDMGVVEETKIDSSLSTSKSKLTELLKRKKEQ